MVIRKVGVLSCGKLSGALYALMGLLLGACFAVISMLGAGAAMAAQDEAGGQALGGMLGAVFGVGAIVFFPIIYGIFGFLGGLLTAFLYNVVAGFVGGIELEVS